MGIRKKVSRFGKLANARMGTAKAAKMGHDRYQKGYMRLPCHPSAFILTRPKRFDIFMSGKKSEKGDRHAQGW
jgi:hypothetical protein